MSKRSEKRSTTFPLPSSPHCAPRMITLLMSKPIHSTACDNLTLYAAFGSLLEARREWIWTTDSGNFNRQAEDLPALRRVQGQRASDEAEYRVLAEKHFPVLVAPVGTRRAVRQRSRPDGARVAPRHDRRCAGFFGCAARGRVLQQRSECEELFDRGLGGAG